MNKYIVVIISAFLFMHCSPKTTAPIMDKVEQTVDQVTSATETFRSAAPAPAPARKVQIGEAETFQLDNGLTVILVENNKIPRVSYRLSLKNDPILEGDQKGYVSFAGQLMNKGTKTKSKAEIDESIDFIGADFQTFSDGFFASSLTKHADKLLAVVTDVLYNPIFPQAEFDKLKTQELSNLAASKSDPSAMSSNVRSKVVYGSDHPYGEVQTEETVNNIDLKKCKDFYNKFFIPNNAYLTIVGDIDRASGEKLANEYFGKWKQKPFKPVMNKKVKGTPERKVIFANKDAAVQSVVNVVYPVNLKPGSEDAIKASVMNTILGGGFSSRLMQNLREDKAFTYGARSSLSSDPLVGRFIASASVRNEVTDSSITEFLYEMDRIATTPVGQKELTDLKNYMAGGFARSLESPQTIARFALNSIKYNLPKDYYQTYLQKLNAVSVEDISMMAKKYITPDNAYIVVVGNKDEVAEKLEQFDAADGIDYYDAFGNEVQYESVALSDDVTPVTIIENYISALGGKDKVAALSTMKTTMEMSIMGQNAVVTLSQKTPAMSAMQVNMNGMTMVEQKFDGESGSMNQMGQSMAIEAGTPMAHGAQNDSKICKQLDYGKDGYAHELKGIETLDGVKAYKLLVTDPNGMKTTEFYSLETSLLVRSISTQHGPGGQTSNLTMDFKDYKEVEGVMFPHKIVNTGMMPTPVEMKITSIEVNTPMDNSMFK